MKSESLRKFCLFLSLSAFTAIGLNACGDDSSGSGTGKEETKQLNLIIIKLLQNVKLNLKSPKPLYNL